MDQSAKDALAEELSARVADGQCIGVGTGTTVEAVLGAVQKRAEAENLRITVVPTSYQSAWRCEELGLTVASASTQRELDWAFDGADEVDPDLRLLKGRGAALLHEKLVAARAKEFVIVVGEDKLVESLGEKMAVPVEVIPESYASVKRALSALGAQEVVLRNATALERTVPLFTQEGNIIVDARFAAIAPDLEHQINQIPGVVDNGIFTDCATEVLIGSSAGTRTLRKN